MKGPAPSRVFCFCPDLDDSNGIRYGSKPRVYNLFAEERWLSFTAVNPARGDYQAVEERQLGGGWGCIRALYAVASITLLNVHLPSLTADPLLA